MTVKSIVIALVALVGSCSASNYAGLCLPAFRYLSDEAIYGAAMSRAFELHQGLVKITGEPSTLVSYSSLDEFKQANADCCSSGKTGREGFQGSFFDKIRGNSRDIIRVSYRDGIGSNKIIWFVVTNCGILRDGLD